MEMIGFKLEPESVWIKGSHSDFDNTELNVFSFEVRDRMRFKINPLTANKRREIAGDLNEKVLTDDGSIIEKINQGHFYKLGQAVLDYILADWEGIYDHKGSVLECTLENKIKIIDGGYPEFGKALHSISTKLMSHFKEYKIEEEDRETKNLKDMSIGQPDG